jgi:hypothetical protein
MFVVEKSKKIIMEFAVINEVSWKKKKKKKKQYWTE